MDLFAWFQRTAEILLGTIFEPFAGSKGDVAISEDAGERLPLPRRFIRCANAYERREDSRHRADFAICVRLRSNKACTVDRAFQSALSRDCR
ncbi:hypothetical protein D9M69_668330 [compost metagenome]